MSESSVPNVIVRPPLVNLNEVRVFDRGEEVVLQVGNSEIAWHYTQAFQLSQHVRLCAKRAKRRAGDTGRHWSAIGVLEDAEKVERGIL